MVSHRPDDSNRSGAANPLSLRGEEILRTADKLFVSMGYTATTMSDLATATGILPGSLYHHFPSKEAVAVALLEAFNADVRALPAALRDFGLLELPPEAQLRRLSKAMAVIGERHAGAVRLRGLIPPSSASERFQGAVNYRPTGMYRLWHNAASDLALLPGVRNADPALLSYSLQTLNFTAGTEVSEALSLDEVVDFNCDLLLYGVCDDPRSDVEFDKSPVLAAVRRTIGQWKQSAGDSDPTRSEILAAARHIFARRGYANTTIRDIAQLSGVPMGTIYRRFDSMHAIYLEAGEAFSRQLHDTLCIALTTEPHDFAAAIDAVAFAVAQTNRAFRDETTIMAQAWASNPPGESVAHQAYRRQVEERLSLLTSIVTDGQQAGLVSTDWPAAELALKLRSVMWVRYTERDRASVRRIQRFVRNHVLRGIMTRPA